MSLSIINYLNMLVEEERNGSINNLKFVYDDDAKQIDIYFTPKKPIEYITFSFKAKRN